jgi:4-hydroxy-4-methyl-2-oxoglutarate aldolase
MIPSDITFAQMREHLFSSVVCDALDAEGFSRQSPRVSLMPLTAGRVLVGRCKTTLWGDMAHPDPRPYELELRAVDACRPDDVLIAAAGGSMRSAIWGDLLTTAALARGCAGAIVDGAVRDVRSIRATPFQVFARGMSVYDSKDRQRVVDIDVPVEIDGIRFSPGDLLIADDDGIVVVPAAVETRVIARAWAKVHAENEVRDALRGGMLATDAFRKFGVL